MWVVYDDLWGFRWHILFSCPFSSSFTAEMLHWQQADQERADDWLGCISILDDRCFGRCKEGMLSSCVSQDDRCFGRCCGGFSVSLWMTGVLDAAEGKWKIAFA